MSEGLNRRFTLPVELIERIEAVLQKRFRLRLTDARELSAAIQKMSDFYIANPLGQTPWHEPWCQIAQLAYYMPLNFLRSRAVMLEGQRFRYFEGIEHVVDFGSGLGPTGLALLTELHRAPTLSVVETSSEALSLSRELGLKFETAARPIAKGSDLLSCSYSLTELSTLPKWLFDFENLMLIEPATRDDGRLLLKTRATLLKAGYEMWAPCPHQGPCPLLEKSAHDWCHDRIHFERPDWWIDVEKNLPFHNQTLTFSYLLASKRPRPVTAPQIRLVGDLLKEKGKSRQMICRGPEREFFAWLNRHGEAPEFPRGSLLAAPENFQAVSAELRLSEKPELIPLEPGKN